MSSVALRYRDVAAASDWLCGAFGFQKHLVATSDTGVVHYAQLTFGDAMLMLAQVRDSALDKYMKQPDEIRGAETQSCFFRVSDADAHCARAKASGAEMILDIQDDAFGGRSYACRDPEGHVWNFGTYDPWQGQRPGHAQSTKSTLLGILRRAVVVTFLATIVACVVVAGGMYGALRPGERSLETASKEAEEHIARAAQERLKTELSAREAAEHVAREALEQLGRERVAKEAVERAAELDGKRMAEERIARNAAEELVREARQELDRMRDTREPNRLESEQLDRNREAKELAERNAAQARQRASEEQGAKEAAERTAQEMREQLDRARDAKELAERSAEQARQRVTEEQSAREVAERAAIKARAELSRERSAKNAALKSASQLRRHLDQLQNAK
jgi:uncharacterized glyoxalase superfamily protein PhnB